MLRRQWQRRHHDIVFSASATAVAAAAAAVAAPAAAAAAAFAATARASTVITGTAAASPAASKRGCNIIGEGQDALGCSERSLRVQGLDSCRLLRPGTTRRRRSR